MNIYHMLTIQVEERGFFFLASQSEVAYVKMRSLLSSLCLGSLPLHFQEQFFGRMELDGSWGRMLLRFYNQVELNSPVRLC